MALIKDVAQCYLSGVMFDSKLHGGHTWAEVELVECVIVVALFEEGSIGRLGEIGLVVE